MYSNLVSRVVHAALVAILALGLACPAFASGAQARKILKPTPDQALEMLQKGNRRFMQGKSRHPHMDGKRLYLAGTQDQGDHAYATVLTCSDSRVPVEILFDAGVMDIFVVRVAGNVVNTDEAGSIEYGIAHVHTPVMVVLGHTQCGAVTAVTNALQGHGHAMERNIAPLVAPIKPAVEQAIKDNPDVHGKDVIPYAIEQNVWQGIEDLFMQSPTARQMHAKGKTRVVGAIYDVHSGRVKWLPKEKVDAILARVETAPNRAMNAMAE
jgi:carbonic anhydrase